MKSIIATLLLGTLFNSCEPKISVGENANTIGIYILSDITSGETLLPSYLTIEGDYGLKQDNTVGALFKLSVISDVLYTPVQKYEIKPQPTLFQNPGDRSMEVTEFLSNVRLALTGFKSDRQGKPRSQIFVPVANMLNDLSAQRIVIKRLIVLSDLVENGELNFYRDSDLQVLYHNPAEIEKAFISSVHLEDLDGVELYLCYTPKDFEDSRRYNAIVGIYKSIVESRHGKVITAGSYTN